MYFYYFKFSLDLLNNDYFSLIWSWNFNTISSFNLMQNNYPRKITGDLCFNLLLVTEVTEYKSWTEKNQSDLLEYDKINIYK